MNSEGFMAEKVYRPIGSVAASKLSPRLDPNYITLISFIIILGGCAMLFLNVYLGVLLLFLGYCFDYSDGEFARKHNKVTNKGGFFDTVLDRLSEMILMTVLTLYLQEYILGIIALCSLCMYYFILGAVDNNFPKGELKKGSKKIFGFVKINWLYLGRDVYMTVILIGILINRIDLIFWFFIVFQNLFWLAIFTMIMRNKQ